MGLMTAALPWLLRAAALATAVALQPPWPAPQPQAEAAHSPLDWAFARALDKELNESNAVMDHIWATNLEVPEKDTQLHAASLADRARGLARILAGGSKGALRRRLPRDLDVVCAGGGGFKPFFLLGALQVLDELAKTDATVSPRLHRYLGHSGCGQTCFMVVLQGNLSQTLTAQLSYSELEEALPAEFHGFNDPYHADRAWRILGSWLVRRYPLRLPRLNNTVFMHVTLVDKPPRNVLVSSYRDAEDAREAFIATGSLGTLYRGKAAADGGLTVLGTEDFPDHQRPRLYVRMARSAVMLAGFDRDEADRMVRQGQDAMAKFLRGGPTWAISIVP
mmetsp:Transcript_39172/g.110730  ORF Transcript_39172/g.110730 Transcript_39172/m.110730 type:complete len:335 (+) Transcript_39172:53-1057(+)